MTAFLSFCSHRPRLFRVCLLLSVVTALASQSSALAADTPMASPAGTPITVHTDKAEVLKLPERTATLVVGNPMIADATVQPGSIMVITAKSYGATNVVALDRNGATLMERTIKVLEPVDNVVVMYRGIERESYSCSPNCERRITLGDSPAYFTATMTQSTARNKQAESATPK